MRSIESFDKLESEVFCCWDFVEKD